MHVAGHVESPGGGGGGDSGLNFQSGQQVIDLTTGQILLVGVGNIPPGGGPPKITVFNPETGQTFPTGLFTTLTGTVFETRNSQQIGGTRTLTQSERASLGLGGGTGGGGGGGGGTVQSFSSTQQGAAFDRETQLQILREQARLAAEQGEVARAAELENQIVLLERQQGFTADQNELSRENQQRISLMNNASQIAIGIANLQQQAKTLIAEREGTNPFRAALLAQGRSTGQSDPFRTFTRELQGAASTQIPQFDPNAPIEALRAQVTAGQNTLQAGLPQPATPLSAAEGGTFNMKQGAAGVLVGEAGPLGEARPEVVRELPGGGFEVIPLTASAAHGGAFQAPSRDVDTDTLNAIRSISPIFRSLGFDSVPLSRPGPREDRTARIDLFSLGEGQNRAGPLTNTLSTLNRLGVQPSLVRDAGSGRVFQLDNGVLKPFVSREQFLGGGFDFPSVVNVDTASLQGLEGFNTGFGRGQTAADLAGQRQDLVPETLGRGPQPLTQPLIDPLTGVVLPDPGLIASMFRFLDPTTQFLIRSIYQGAGSSTTDFERRRLFATPGGSAVQGLTAALA